MLQTHLEALVFDLDGTLYVSSEIGGEISRTACGYIADLKRIAPEEADLLIRRTRQKLSQQQNADATLSMACIELGGDLKELHRRFAAEIRPERFLSRDERVVDLLGMLAGGFELYLYTNNNRHLSQRIMKTLGITDLFRRVFTIEETWSPKPDRRTLENILREIGRKPEECLFVGDRYDIDLKLPAELGSAVCLVKSVDELLPLCRLLHEENL